MSIEDLFQFVPVDQNANDDTRSQVILLDPEKDKLKTGGKFFGIIKTGDKCVPPSKLNPKQRRGIASINNEAMVDNYAYPSAADKIIWSEDSLNVLQLAQISEDEYPLVVKVDSGCSKFSDVELFLGQNLLVHSRGVEQRIIAYDVTSSKRLDIPNDLHIQASWNGRKLSIKEILSRSLSTAKVKVIECESHVADINGHVIVLRGEVSSRYIVCNDIFAGWVDQSGLIIVPESTKIEFRIGKGLRGGGDEEWNDFLGMLKRSVRHQFDHDARGYPEIIVEELEEKEISSVEKSNERLPSYENVEIDLTRGNGTLQFETLKPQNRPIIYENCDLIKHTSHHYDKDKLHLVKSSERSTYVNLSSSLYPTQHINPSTSEDFTNTIKFQSASNYFKRFTNDVEHSQKQSKDTHSTVLLENQTNSGNVPNRINLQTNLSTANKQNPTQKSAQLATKTPAPTREAQMTKLATISTTRISPKSSTRERTNSMVSDQTPENFKFPDEVEGLASSQVQQCLVALRLDTYCKMGWNIDGRTLSNMDAKDMENKLNMNPFDAAKLLRFVRGWRP